MRSRERPVDDPEDSQLTPGFDCELCNTRFFRKHHLERHIQNIHEGQRPWTCDVCGFAFHQKPNLGKFSWGRHPCSVSVQSVVPVPLGHTIPFPSF